MNSIRENIGISLMLLVYFLIMLLIEIRRRRYDPNYQMNFKHPKMLSFMAVWFLIFPILILAPMQWFRDYLANNINPSIHLIISGLIAIVIFALIYTVFWRYKDRFLLEPDKTPPPLELQRSRALFASSLCSYLFFSLAYFKNGDFIFMLGVIAIFFVFLTYELKVKRRQKAK